MHSPELPFKDTGRCLLNLSNDIIKSINKELIDFSTSLLIKSTECRIFDNMLPEIEWNRISV